MMMMMMNRIAMKRIVVFVGLASLVGCSGEEEDMLSPSGTTEVTTPVVDKTEGFVGTWQYTSGTATVACPSA